MQSIERMNDIGVAVVVVTYQSAETIGRCLDQLRVAQSVEEIRIVDNGSVDQTLPIVQRHALADPRVRFIANNHNPGFASACNQGAMTCRSSWLAFVNPDLIVSVDTFVAVRGYADALNPAVLGVELRDEDGHLDVAARRKDLSFLAILRAPRTASQLAVPKNQYEVCQRVPAISGAFVFMPRALFIQLGGWDSRYRLHVEDLDLCRRARQVGAVVAVVNAVQVMHLRGVSSRSRPFFVAWHKHRGFWRYFRKFEANESGILVRLSVWLIIVAHGLKQIVAALIKIRHH